MLGRLLGCAQICFEAIQTTEPAYPVIVDNGLAGVVGMFNDHFGLRAAGDKTHCHPLPFAGSRIGFRTGLPGILDQVGFLDANEFAGDPEDRSVGQLVGDAIGATDAQIDVAL